MRCSECGTEAQEGDRYCSRCGRLLDGGAGVDVGETGAPGMSWAGRGTATSEEAEAVGGRPRVEVGEAELATFGRRLGGFLIDSLLWFGVMIAVMMAIYLVRNGMPAAGETIPQAEADRITILTYATVFPLLLVVTCFFNAVGWSAGKRAVGIRIVCADGSAPGWLRGIGRTFGAWLSWLPVGLGFLWAAWDERSQTWHDKMAGTFVVRAEPPRGPR